MYYYKFLRFPGGKAKAVTLSYDDGSRADLKFSDVITEKGKDMLDAEYSRILAQAQDYRAIFGKEETL